MESPFTPGVGLEPKFLAGRDEMIADYQQRLKTNQNQQKNTLIVGLRGVGKSVLLKTLTKAALSEGWVPVMHELSKRNNDEDELIVSLLADISLRLKSVTISRKRIGMGLHGKEEIETQAIDLLHLVDYFKRQAGDKGDRFQATLAYVSDICVQIGQKGLVLLLDEFQLLEDQKEKNQYSLSLILDAISRLQSSTEKPIHAVLAGLPTMQSKMVESKPHAERLFSRVINLGALSMPESKAAISEPLKTIQKPRHFSDGLIDYISEVSEGYPFFIQYFANEAFYYFQHTPIKRSDFEEILPEIHAKLDEHFYGPRFAATSMKERAVTLATAELQAPFTPTDVLEAVKRKDGDVTMGTIQQYLLVLQEKNIMYKIRRGAYDYAMPIFKKYLQRCLANGEDPSAVLAELGQR